MQLRGRDFGSSARSLWESDHEVVEQRKTKHYVQFLHTPKKIQLCNNFFELAIVLKTMHKCDDRLG